MNTYLMPIADVDKGGDVWIEKVNAYSITNAEDKFVKLLSEIWDCECDTIDDLVEWANVNGFIIGDIYDLEEF